VTRKLPDFLTAYFEYARDGFCPDPFHKWMGFSILSAALERKVTLKQGKIHHFPNIYVMLVSHPAVGKSTALNRGLDLLEEIKKNYKPNFRIVPEQATEPALVDLMKVKEQFTVGNGMIQLWQSPGYFAASEASASALQNTCGDFVATMTAMYDCPKYFRKKLKSDKDTVEIENVSMSMIAGATFNYLKELVNETSVMGGFASRLIYVVSKERKIRDGKWSKEESIDEAKRQALIHDLNLINNLSGPITPTRGFMERWEQFQPDFDRELIALKSERMESLLSRKGTNLIKIAILLSVSEGDSLMVNEKHFDRAKEIIDDVTKDNAFILGQALMSNTTSQKGCNIFLARTVRDNGGEMNLKALRHAGVVNGNDLEMVKKTLEFMVNSEDLALVDNGRVKLLVDPDSYL
jgi:hypothetical protein